VAAANAAGGVGSWGSTREFSAGVPVSELPLHEVPALLAWFNDALRTCVAPLLASAFPRDVRAPAQLRVRAAHLLRYAADAEERHLPLHAHEDAAFSLTIALSPKTDFAGGGTFFDDGCRTVVCPDVGHVVAFRGRVRHGGEPLTAGVRYVIACDLALVPLRDVPRGAGGGGDAAAGV
jgi:predicted 2-oxoglutarate/Fe(II)-dependent dioxygenase YbiX